MKSRIYGIVNYNEKYLILGDINGILLVYDLNINKIISKINTEECSGIISIKKLIHPKYGESILTYDRNGCIKLWTTN